MFWRSANESLATGLPVQRCIGRTQEVEGSSVINSSLRFPSHLPRLPPFFLSLPPSLPLSSALAQDRINIPLKPVSTAAGSPSLPSSLLLLLLLFPPLLSPDSFQCHCFVEGIALPPFLHTAAGRGSFITFTQEFPLLHTCMQTHTHKHRGVVGTDAFDRAC